MVKEGRWQEVSIHAPAWGATQAASSDDILGDVFQSTLPRGERLEHLDTEVECADVSIHAPAWGATCLSWVRTDPIMGFNPRSRVGSDPVPEPRRIPPSVFQSTLPRGERRRGTSVSVFRLLCFNPRSRVGSDSTYALDHNTGHVSIHAPAWGATVSILV